MTGVDVPRSGSASVAKLRLELAEISSPPRITASNTSCSVKPISTPIAISRSSVDHQTELNSSASGGCGSVGTISSVTSSASVLRIRALTRPEPSKHGRATCRERVSVRVDRGGSRNIQKKKKIHKNKYPHK